jgi:predicted DNA-binding protein (UPF0251 family)
MMEAGRSCRRPLAMQATKTRKEIETDKPIRGRRSSKFDGILPFRHGEVIDLVYYHGKTIEEVADIVGINEATVKRRMFYARSKLAELATINGKSAERRILLANFEGCLVVCAFVPSI